MRLSQLQEIFDTELKNLENVLLIDIGADLGLLGIRLLKAKRVDFVWNVELSEKALEQSRQLYERNQLLKKVNFFYSDGFQRLSTENIGDRSVVLVLAGFGANTSLSILNQLNQDWLSRKLWLISLPHTCPLNILKWARENNWNLIRENYFKYRSKIYPILLFSNYWQCISNSKHDKKLFLEYWGQRFEKMSKWNMAKLTLEAKKHMMVYLEFKQKNLS